MIEALMLCVSAFVVGFVVGEVVTRRYYERKGE